MYSKRTQDKISKIIHKSSIYFLLVEAKLLNNWLATKRDKQPTFIGKIPVINEQELWI